MHAATIPSGLANHVTAPLADLAKGAFMKQTSSSTLPSVDSLNKRTFISGQAEEPYS